MNNYETLEADLNLEEIDTSTFLGKCVVDSYKVDPELAIRELKSAYIDNPEMVLEVIGENNVQKIK